MNTKCKFMDSDNLCKFNCNYGDYCYKHRRDFLIVNDDISRDRFTGLSKDYLKNDLVRYRKNKMRRKSLLSGKEELFQEISKHITTINGYHKLDHTKEIIMIQSLFRGRSIREKNKGLKCNNDEDFYTYTPKEEIEDIYFFSYKDSQHNVWCFDIRSLKKLIDMNYDNPYTTEEIPNNIKCLVKNYMNKLIKQGILEKIVDTTVRDRETAVKQKLVDIFSQIEFCGYSCDIQWILSLNIHNLRNLYRKLEDIWNYRANLPEPVKISIAPPDGRLFTQHVHDVMSSSKIEVLEIITSNIHKILNAHTPDDMRLGFMYFLVGLSEVSRECLLIHSWVQYVY